VLVFELNFDKKMDAEEPVAIHWLLMKKSNKEKKQRHMYWIHPIIDRSEKRLFFTLYANMQANPDKVFLFA